MTGLDPKDPLVIDVRTILQRRAGSMVTVTRSVPAPAGLGVAMARVPEGSPIDLDLRLESVLEGVLVTGSADLQVGAECSRCLEPIGEDVQVRIGELFAYPDSVTEETTDADEIPRLVDERIDLTQTVRDAIVTELPMAPLCREDCPGLCVECGERWADLPSDHGHETLDPRWAALRERLPSTD